MPRVSIVIPAYNSEPYLEATLQSVLRGNFNDYEVVVVNDGSLDRTTDIVLKHGSHVRLISQENAGVSASRNNGINSGDSEFIALLDSDDLWHPDKLKYQIEALDKRPSFSFCFTDFKCWDGSDPADFMYETRTGAINNKWTGWIYHLLILENWALNSSLLFRRIAWDQMGPFPCMDQQTDDWEYLVHCSQSFQFVRLSEPMVLYRQYDESLSRKLPSLNTSELMRESLLSRFGMHSIDGSPVSQEELDLQRYAGWSNFADAHCARGDLGIGLANFSRLLLRGPRRSNTIKRLFKSLGHRILAKPRPQPDRRHTDS